MYKCPVCELQFDLSDSHFQEISKGNKVLLLCPNKCVALIVGGEFDEELGGHQIYSKDIPCKIFKDTDSAAVVISQEVRNAGNDYVLFFPDPTKITNNEMVRDLAMGLAETDKGVTIVVTYRIKSGREIYEDIKAGRILV